MLHDVRHALRLFRARPLFAATAVVTLALGIAATTLMFTVANALLWRPFPYDRDGRLVAVLEVERGRPRSPTSPANYRDWTASTTLEAMTAAHPWSPTLTGRERAERLVGLKASPSLFALFETRPLLGTTFSEAAVAREPRVVVLGYDLWQRSFGGDAGVVGRPLVLDGQPHTVIGVMPAGFSFPPFWHTRAGLWAPLVFTPEQASQRGARMLRVFARLRAGRTIEAARGEMRLLQARLAREYPADNADVGVEVEPLLEPTVGDARTVVITLVGAVGFVLLIASANVASLLLARAVGQAGELAVRQALGAGAWRLAREQFAQGLVLAAAGAVVGVAAAWAGVLALGRVLAEHLPRGAEVGMDARVLAFATLALVATGVLVAAAPALLATRTDVVARLRSGLERGTTTRAAARRWIVAGQLALACTLLVGTGLMLRSLARLDAADPGFSREHVLTMTATLPKERYAVAQRQAAWVEDARSQLAALPGVARVGFVNHLPVGGDTWRTAVTVEGAVPRPPGQELRASYRAATPGYFAAIGIRRVSGRDFEAADRHDTRPVAIVNERFVREYLAGADPVGRRIALGRPDRGDPWVTIVGVVGDASQVSVRERADPEVYLPYTQNPVAWFTSAAAVVRTHGDPLAQRRAVEAVLEGLEPDAPIADVRTTGQVLDETTSAARFNTWLLTAFGVAALVLAGVGLYGVIDYSVAERRREFGIRLALGAQKAGIVGLVVREGGPIVAAGCLAGLVAAALLSRLLATALYGVSPGDAVTYALAVGMLAVTALAACALPALRVARLDPARALRSE